jgi:hypothetical protein
MPEENRPPEGEVRDNRPPEGEIPDILEWKLDVIMAQLAKMGGGLPTEHNPRVGTGTRPRLPPPDEFDPPQDPFPHQNGIPEILEWKLDVIMVQLNKSRKILLNLPLFLLVFLPNIFVFVLVPGLGAIIALLTTIAGLLSGIQALLLFVVIQVVVPFLIARNKKLAAQFGSP